ncbi:peptidoglycan-binding protein [Actinoplanes sp. Pm04-4]|uniref:Peptidoglycan-binding protein n=1 Tax=Paractinoplanes pyxinae TaxID=2997416 RepID=A0ABT4BFU6_9ACTN|nr:peptidoglycan-binding protein [Actinoplanes pyxinae]MCY1145421.1 peptidoglycan-binding protein [Actinoplanes pyxinae]
MTAAALLKEARKLLGTTEHPPGSNHNHITQAYGFDDAWCEMTVWYAARESHNVDAMFGKYAYTVRHAQVFKDKGRWHYGLGGIRPGDIVYFDWSGTGKIANIDHVGMVEAVNSDGTVITIEGNTSDKCRRMRRNGACVVGYGRPAYGNAAPMPSTDGILRLGSRGNAVRTLQESLNKVMKAGLDVDGDFGKKTAAALITFQRKHNLEPDGEYGPATAVVLRGALTGRPGPVQPRPKAPLAVDGQLGRLTWAAVQRALNGKGARLEPDGRPGPLTIKALQSYLGVTADGQLGPVTVKALQRRVGAAVDGRLGPDTVKHWQTALVAGKF